VEHNGKGVRIDGGSATLDLGDATEARVWDLSWTPNTEIPRRWLLGMTEELSLLKPLFGKPRLPIA
jgi:hypothetical protein